MDLIFEKRSLSPEDVVLYITRFRSKAAVAIIPQRILCLFMVGARVFKIRTIKITVLEKEELDLLRA